MGSLTDEILDEYYNDREIIRSYQPDQQPMYKLKRKRKCIESQKKKSTDI
jgi:hypothetical protein